MPKPSEGRLLYHITRISNLPSILQNGLMPRRELLSGTFEDIADQDIIMKRSQLDNDLAEYVPFHFYAKNPFDGAVCKSHGVEQMALITIGRDLGEAEGYIIPSHPLDGMVQEMFPYEEGFGKVNWAVLDDYDNRDYQNPEIKKQCMAECLIKRRIRPEEFVYIYVHDEDARAYVEGLLKEHDLDDIVKVFANENMFPRV